MKVTLSWIKEYIALDLEPEEIASKLTMAGLEVDAIEEMYAYLQDIVVAKVLEVKKHPDADKLSCCVVDTGGKKTGSDYLWCAQRKGGNVFGLRVAWGDSSRGSQN